MEQVMVFWTEYANEISGAASLLGVVLMLVALHKIKQIGVQLKRLTEGAAAVLEEPKRDVIAAEEVQLAQAAAMDGRKEDAAPEELLDAVLGEVFS